MTFNSSISNATITNNSTTSGNSSVNRNITQIVLPIIFTLENLVTHQVLIVLNSSVIANRYVSNLTIVNNGTESLFVNYISACENGFTSPGLQRIVNGSGNSVTPVTLTCNCSSTPAADCGCACDDSSNYNGNWTETPCKRSFGCQICQKRFFCVTNLNFEKNVSEPHHTFPSLVFHVQFNSKHKWI